MIKRMMLLGLMWMGINGWGYENTVVDVYTWGGPNLYADGEEVPDGEQIAFVLVPPGYSFGGLYTDGTAVDESNIVMSERKTIRYDMESDWESWANINIPTTYVGYTVIPLLLDTRTESGAVGGSIVHGYAVWGTGTIRDMHNSASFPEDDSMPEFLLTVDCETIPLPAPDPTPLLVPVLTGIELDEAQGVVTLSVTNTMTKLSYGVLSTENLCEPFVRMNGILPVHGASSPEATILLTVPLKAGANAQFYKILGEE